LTTPALAEEVRDPPPAAPAVPQRIGRFLIREEIGRGSNGVVYSATDPVLGRDVAIKAIPLSGQGAGAADREAGFLQEAKIAAGLNHPSIVTVFDAGKTDAIAYIAMERLKGSDLHHWLATNRAMPAENAAALIARVADAVHFAHRRGLIHRDIKPSNIFLGRDMKPKVLDFGIALAQEQQDGADESKKLIGTPNYMSPEQALGRPLDARSDVFSIGAILYELITGHRAFDGANIDEILNRVVRIDPPAMSSWRPEVSQVICQIVMRALAKDPAQRYQTAAQLRNDLAAFAGRPVAPPTSPAGDVVPETPRPSLHLPGPAALISTGVAVVGLSLTFALWYSTHGSGTGPSATAAAPAAATDVPPPASLPGAAPINAPSPAARSQAGTANGTALAPLASPATPVSHHPRPGTIAAAHGRTAAPAAAPTPPPAAATEPGSLSLAIVPWGEIVLDGAKVGVSPPVSHLSLAPGRHSIELRNGSAPAYVVQIEVESGKSVLIEHRF
jgi:serine/threonine protein kinase